MQPFQGKGHLDHYPRVARSSQPWLRDFHPFRIMRVRRCAPRDLLYFIDPAALLFLVGMTGIEDNAITRLEWRLQADRNLLTLHLKNFA